MKKQVILITDGDLEAQEAIIQACKNEDIYLVMESAGTPTPKTGAGLAREIKNAPGDPVVVMLDDHGKAGKGNGERALQHLLADDELEILGVIAVASNTRKEFGVKVDESVDRNGRIVDRPVDKNGRMEPDGHYLLEGDTVDILSYFPEIKVIGVGDLGKMKGRDDPSRGAHITTRCLQELLYE
ncbi:MAG: stage V sporulation protein AE [Syntrophomonadaceae bacterium]|nr:stage V sporulation protein AE [Syntrophomonadaceae bacterium]